MAQQEGGLTTVTLGQIRKGWDQFCEWREKQNRLSPSKEEERLAAEWSKVRRALYYATREPDGESKREGKEIGEIEPDNSWLAPGPLATAFSLLHSMQAEVIN